MNTKHQNSQASSFATAASTTNDVLKFVRQNINLHKDRDNYPAQRVRTRLKKVFCSYRDEDNWKQAMDRRNEQMKCGFFARIDCPYKDCGDVELNSKQLVVKSLKNIGNHFAEKPNLELTSTLQGEPKQRSEQPGTGKETQDSSSSKVGYNWRLQETNGMNTIKDYIQKTEKRIVSVKAGQPLSAYLRKEKEEQMIREQEEEIKVPTLDMRVMNPLEQGAVVQEIDGEHVKQPCRRSRDFLDKLDCLITLFGMINNMRVRDLKSKVPLSQEMLNLIQKTPSSESYFYNSRLSRRSMTVSNGYPLINNDNNNNTLAATTTTANLTTAANNNKPVNKMLVTPNMLTNFYESNSRLDVITPTPLPPSTGRKTRNLQQPPSQRVNKSSPLGMTKVENWDDLLNVDTNPVQQRLGSVTQETDQTNYRGTSRLSVNGRILRSRRQGPCYIKTVTESLPPWQKISIELKDNEKDAQLLKTASHLDKKNEKVDEVLDNLINHFEKTKQNNVEKITEQLNERIDAYKVQFDSLTLGKCREKDLKEMRNKVNDWREEISMSTAKPPAWYEALRSEQKCYDLQEDNNTNVQLEKISKFLDIKPNHHALAKLCLLVFSFPVYQLCKHPMQDAIKFFMGDVMEVTHDYLTDWMKYRQLITTKLTKDEK